MEYCNRIIHEIMFMNGEGNMIEVIEKMFETESEIFNFDNNTRSFGF